jgi:hypothetical protein
MPYVAEAEPMEIAPDLRTMPNVETSGEAHAALDRLADGYAAMTRRPSMFGMNRDHGRHEGWR